MKMVIRALLAAAILVLGYGILLIDAAAVRGSSNLNVTTSLGGISQDTENFPVLDLKTPQIMKRKHYEWCKWSLDQCTRQQGWFKQVVIENTARLTRLNRDHKTGQARFMECHPTIISSPKPHEIAARQLMGGGGLLGGLIPGLSPATQIIDDTFTRLSELINPIPRQCNQTEQCYANTQQIRLILHEQYANMTWHEQAIADYAAQSTQCIEEQVEAHENGLQSPSALAKRGDRNKYRVEAKDA